MLAAYLSVPLLFYLVQIDWYGLFIVLIPVYIFVIVPFLVALGGRDPRGSVFSAGAINFGLFLFVYCLGHLAYLARSSTALALLVVLGVMVCDLIDRQVSRGGGGWFLKFAIAVLPAFALAYVLGRPVPTEAIRVSLACRTGPGPTLNTPSTIVFSTEWR